MDSDTVIEQIKAIVEDSDCWIFGIRSLHQDETPAIGDTMAESVVWDDNDRTDEGIGGTCCFSVSEYGINTDKAMDRAIAYNLGHKGRYVLLGGKYCGNNDLISEPHTVAIRDAVVLLVWEA